MLCKKTADQVCIVMWLHKIKRFTSTFLWTLNCVIDGKQSSINY